MNLHSEIRLLGDQALAASRRMVNLSSRRKNAILDAMAQELDARRAAIQAANAQDVAEACAAGLAAALVDRLTLTDARFCAMIQGIREVAALPDPVGKRLAKRVRPNGIVIEKRRVPIGVVAIIFESRPNVTADAAVLCIKSSNAVILRGGKEAIRSNQAIAEALAEGGQKAGLPRHAVQLVATIDREAVRELVQMDDRVDVVIPRGGESLIRAVVEQSRVPVCLSTGTRDCSTTARISDSPPRGMTTSTRSSICTRWRTASRSVVAISCTACKGSPAFCPPSASAAAMA